jgi:hypothetical protein
VVVVCGAGRVVLVVCPVGTVVVVALPGAAVVGVDPGTVVLELLPDEAAATTRGMNGSLLSKVERES